MSRDYRINTFGLTEEQNALVEDNIPTRDYEVFDTDAPTDLIAINCEVLIIYAPEMDQDSIGMIFDYYSQVNGCTDETVIWLGEPKPPKELQKFSNATIPLMQSRTSSNICCSRHTARVKRRTNTVKSW